MDKPSASEKQLVLLTDTPDLGAIRRLMEIARSAPVPILPEPQHPYQPLPIKWMGVDPAKPGSERTAIRYLVADEVRLEILTYCRSVCIRIQGLKKSQRATERRLRFERNKARRLNLARFRRSLRG